MNTHMKYDSGIYEKSLCHIVSDGNGASMRAHPHICACARSIPHTHTRIDSDTYVVCCVCACADVCVCDVRACVRACAGVGVQICVRVE